MPCREWFDEQDQDYRDSVIPPTVKARVSVEAGVSMGWRDLVGDAGRIISIEHYGASASGAMLFEEFGFSADTVVAAAKESLSCRRATPLHPPMPPPPDRRARPTSCTIPASPSAERACDARTHFHPHPPIRRNHHD